MPSQQLVKDHVDKEIPEIAKWDPDLTKRVVGILRPVVKRYFRSVVKDLGRIPVGARTLVQWSATLFGQRLALGLRCEGQCGETYQEDQTHGHTSVAHGFRVAAEDVLGRPATDFVNNFFRFIE